MKHRNFILAGILLIYSSSAIPKDLKNWSISLNSEIFSKKYLGSYNQKLNDVLSFKGIQVIYDNRKTETDGITNLATIGVKVSLIGAVGSVDDVLANLVRTKLPKPGCKDSNKVSPNGVQLLKNNKVIRHKVLVSGVERACDWPNAKYGSWNKPIWLDLEIKSTGKEISIIPNLASGSTNINKSLAGRIGVESMRILNQLGVTSRIVNPSDLAKSADNLFYQASRDINNNLNGKKLRLNNDSFFKGQEWSGLSKKFRWQMSSGFTQHVHEAVNCAGNISTFKNYKINLDYATAKNISVKAAKSFDAELRNLFHGYGKITEDKVTKVFKNTMNKAKPLSFSNCEHYNRNLMRRNRKGGGNNGHERFYEP